MQDKTVVDSVLMMENEWIKVSHKTLPPPYQYVLVKDNNGNEWQSYVYPSGKWMFDKKPEYWKNN